MSDPQIARRCSFCGASIRERAFFCPHCGRSLSHSTDATTGSAESAPTQALEQTIIERATPPAIESSPAQHQVQPFQRPGGNALGYGAGSTAQRSPRGSQAFEGEEPNRAEKSRRISSVVLDEAAYDPSLRFVLVGAALFVLFLTILILSKVLG